MLRYVADAKRRGGTPKPPFTLRTRPSGCATRVSAKAPSPVLSAAWVVPKPSKAGEHAAPLAVGLLVGAAVRSTHARA